MARIQLVEGFLQLPVVSNWSLSAFLFLTRPIKRKSNGSRMIENDRFSMLSLRPAGSCLCRSILYDWPKMTLIHASIPWELQAELFRRSDVAPIRRPVVWPYSVQQLNAVLA